MSYVTLQKIMKSNRTFKARSSFGSLSPGHWPMSTAPVTAMLISLVASCWFMLHLAYRDGALNLHPQYFTGFAAYPSDFAAQKLANPTGPSLVGWLWTGFGALIMGVLSSQLTFLAYGTTARAARFYGIGDRRAAIGEGVQATWLALGIGTAIVLTVQLFARPLVSALAGASAGGEVADAAVPWVRIASLAVPAILVAAAGNGWMRGVQDTVRPLRYVVVGFALSAVLCPTLVYGLMGAPELGLSGSAVANVVGQWLAAGLFIRALIVERVPLGLRASVLKAQVVMGRDLVLRTMAFQACFVSAGAVAARFGAAVPAACDTRAGRSGRGGSAVSPNRAACPGSSWVESVRRSPCRPARAVSMKAT